MLYAFFWVITWRLVFICRRFGTLCLFHLHRQVDVSRTKLGMRIPSSFYSHLPAYEDGTDSVPKRRHINSRRRGITQKKAYNKTQFTFSICLVVQCDPIISFISSRNTVAQCLAMNNAAKRHPTAQPALQIYHTHFRRHPSSQLPILSQPRLKEANFSFTFRRTSSVVVATAKLH